MSEKHMVVYVREYVSARTEQTRAVARKALALHWLQGNGLDVSKQDFLANLLWWIEQERSGVRAAPDRGYPNPGRDPESAP